MIEANPLAPGCDGQSENSPNGDGYNGTVEHFLTLNGLNPNQSERSYIANAINTQGPFTCLVGQRMVFRTQVANRVDANYAITTRFYELLAIYILVGLGSNVTLTPASVKQDGNSITDTPQNSDLFIDLGNIGSAFVHTKFNEGTIEAPANQAWEIIGEKFITAVVDDNGTDKATIWKFTGGDGFWGGENANTDPNIFLSGAGDFDNLSNQENPFLTAEYSIVEFPLNLTGIDTTQPELDYVVDAIKDNAPFTVEEGQRMEFTTNTIVGDSQANYGWLKRVYRLKKNLTHIPSGLGPQVTLYATDITPRGRIKPVLEAEADGTFIDIGDLDGDTVEDKFNEGTIEAPIGEPWNIDNEKIITGLINDVKQFWLFKGKVGFLYGGDDAGTDPNILLAGADDFLHLNPQPEVPNSFSLGDLDDVDVSNGGLPIEDESSLVYDSNSEKWKSKKMPSNAVLGTGAAPTSLYLNKQLGTNVIKADGTPYNTAAFNITEKVVNGKTSVFYNSTVAPLLNINFANTNQGFLTIGTKYEITAIGNTDFTLIGAASNTVGLEFYATGEGVVDETGLVKMIPVDIADDPFVASTDLFMELIYNGVNIERRFKRIDTLSLYGIDQLKDELKKTDTDSGNITGTHTVDWSLGIQSKAAMTADTTISFSNVVEGKTIVFELTGAFTAVFPTGVNAATLSGYDGAKRNFITVYCADATTPIYLTSLEER